MKGTVYESRLLVGVEEPYSLHKHLWQMVGGHHEERPLLYRADRLPDGYMVHFRVADPTVVKKMELEPIDILISEGDTFQFELRTIPERRSQHRVVETPRGKAAIPWLAERAERNGFTVAISDAISQPLVFHGKHRRRITLNDTWFTGSLTVTDPNRFFEAYTRGIGRHRGFGFGLIQLARH